MVTQTTHSSSLVRLVAHAGWASSSQPCVVMNPVDHPMGGGEGRASGGHPRSRKGLYAKGLKTRAPKKQSSKYIIERRKK